MAHLYTIRHVIHDDFIQWLPLWRGYNRFYERDALSEEMIQSTWSHFLDANQSVYALVAEKEGQLFGLAHYLFHPSTSQVKPVCYLQDLFTQEAVRGQGVGRALIEAVYEYAAAAGAPQVYWHTREDNFVARSLYDKVARLSAFVRYTKVLG